MKLHHLPEDVLRRIVGYLSNAHLLTVRLVCRRLKALTAHRPLLSLNLVPTTNSFYVWAQFLKHESTRSSVRRVVVGSTSKTPTELTLYEAFYDEGRDPFCEISNLPHLYEVHLDFDTVFRGLKAYSTPAMKGEFKPGIEEAGCRRDFLVRMFKHMAKRDANPNVGGIRCLEIFYLQNMPLPALTSSDDFKSVMRSIIELRLHMLVNSDNGLSVYDIDQLESVEFEPHIHSEWLRPSMNQLTSLDLSFDGYWGTLPGTFNGKGLVFPHLKHLSLGRFAISHHDHLDWVLAQRSLNGLVLDQCVITRYLQVETEKIERWGVATHDWEAVPLESIGVSSYRQGETLYRFPRTWSEVYGKIQRGLPRLTEFLFLGYCWSRYNTFKCTFPDNPWKGSGT